MKHLFTLACLVLIASVLLAALGCGGSEQKDDKPAVSATAATPKKQSGGTPMPGP